MCSIRLSVFLRLFCHDRNGAVAIIFALSIIPVMAGIAATIDMSRLQSSRSVAAAAGDATVLAAAVAAKNKDTREDIARRFLESNFSENNRSNAGINNIDIVFDDIDKKVTISFDVETPVIFSKILERDTATSHITVSALYPEKGRRPLSLGLVLDASGSMGPPLFSFIGASQGKIATLKKAVQNLLRILSRDDPQKQYVRTGMVAYSHRLIKSKPFKLGAGSIWPAVSKIVAGGSTNSGVGMQAMLSMIRNEANAHGADTNPIRVVIFMTDGQNNNYNIDARTLRLCSAMKADDVTIYTVNFSGGFRAQNLLSTCASSHDHYYDAKNTSQFLNAFKDIAGKVNEQSTRLLM